MNAFAFLKEVMCGGVFELYAILMNRPNIIFNGPSFPQSISAKCEHLKCKHRVRELSK